MKKSELFTRIALAVLIVIALFAVALQIFNSKTNAIETTYEIVTFSVAFVAVILAVLQGLDNARTSRELRKIAHEIHQNIENVKELDRDSNEMRDLIANDVKISKESLKILEEKSSLNKK